MLSKVGIESFSCQKHLASLSLGAAPPYSFRSKHSTHHHQNCPGHDRLAAREVFSCETNLSKPALEATLPRPPWGILLKLLKVFWKVLKFYFSRSKTFLEFSSKCFFSGESNFGDGRKNFGSENSNFLSRKKFFEDQTFASKSVNQKIGRSKNR